MLLPGSTIGILGSGQLGRMLALVARRMGYRVQVYSPERDSPAGRLADHEWVAPYDDLEQVHRFADAVDVVTFEFENVPSATVAALAERVTVRPDGRALHIAQNRLREKAFLSSIGLPVVPFRSVRSLEELRHGLDTLGSSAVLKTAAFGYDGKGQVLIESAEEAESAWHAVGEQPAVLERYLRFRRELSVVAARGQDGQIVAYPPIENDHQNHILDLSLCPATMGDAQRDAALGLARTLLDALAYVGVLCIELFEQEDGTLLVNEIAPRPHNSGHLTIEAFTVSQFEQQLRATCGLPLGQPTLRSPAAMANLLGDLWQAGEPDWAAALAMPGVALHLYGKTEARPGRKMGHLTATAPSVEEARDLVRAARDALTHA